MIFSLPWPAMGTHESRGTPIAVAACVRVLMPTSWSASPRLRRMSWPGRASEPTARIHTMSRGASTPSACRTRTSVMSVGCTAESGTTNAATASTRPSTAVRTIRPRPHTRAFATS